MLKGKKILLGVTGSIAAYKSAVLTRLLIRNGAEVNVIMTPSARDFITPLTLSTLSRNPVYSGFTSGNDDHWVSHVDLGLWADVFLIAPASANTLARLASGICDNLLLAVYLSAKCPVFLAPAMDLDMYRHPSTLRNLARLEEYGNRIIPAETGELASGLSGPGRMAEPENLLAYLEDYFKNQNRLKGKLILVTAGPTREPIDPVRFIGNHSTGKMGIALARELTARGARVKLILGPSSSPAQVPGLEIFPVQTALEMFEASKKIFPACDAALFSAAVADYRPSSPSKEKIRKSKDTITLTLTKNPDIAEELGKMKKKGQVTAGFALESTRALESGKSKLKSKYFDFIVVNSLEDEGAGFGGDTNKITILDRSGKKTAFPLKPKTEVAKDIIDHLTRYL